jgi:hypothetical protein
LSKIHPEPFFSSPDPLRVLIATTDGPILLVISDNQFAASVGVGTDGVGARCDSCSGYSSGAVVAGVGETGEGSGDDGTHPESAMPTKRIDKTIVNAVVSQFLHI